MLMDEIKAGTTFTLDYARPIIIPPTLGFCSLGIQKIHLQIGNGKGQSIVFIPHVPGMVNFYEPLQNEDIMSGDFTGCVMSTYKVNDKRRIGHVHTGGDTGCRLAMKHAIETGLTLIKAFKPYDDDRDSSWIDKEVYPVCYREGKGFHTFGVVTAQNEQYSIFTLADQKKPEKFKVLLVMRQTNQPNEFR